MLATAGDLPPGPGWAFELKWDGVRALAVVSAAGTSFFSRSGNEITQAYPELREPGPIVGGADDVVLDGEVVAMDSGGRPSFQALAERIHVRDPERARRLSATRPVTYLVFDVPRLEGTNLFDVPYAERRALLERLHISEAAAARVVVPPAFDDGAATMAASREHGLEGVVAKRVDSRYLPGTRSRYWIKVKHERTGDFVVGGWRPGARELGALLIGVPAAPQPPAGLAYRGRVGGGISAVQERSLLAALRPLVTTAEPFGGTIPRDDARTAVWVRPELVVEVRYGDQTRDRRLRFPRFLRQRPDKSYWEVDDG